MRAKPGTTEGKMTASRTLFVEVWGYDHPCSECQHSMTWVFGLRPWCRPAVGELVTCDKTMAVNDPCELLERDGSGDLAAQLKPRPVGGTRCELQSEHLHSVW